MNMYKNKINELEGKECSEYKLDDKFLNENDINKNIVVKDVD